MDKKTRERIDRAKERICITKEDLASLRKRYLPVGSGPHGPMTTVCALVEILAEQIGIDLEG